VSLCNHDNQDDDSNENCNEVFGREHGLDKTGVELVQNARSSGVLLIYCLDIRGSICGEEALFLSRKEDYFEERGVSAL
jgi:hypothetical protein